MEYKQEVVISERRGRVAQLLLGIDQWANRNEGCLFGREVDWRDILRSQEGWEDFDRAFQANRLAAIRVSDDSEPCERDFLIVHREQDAANQNDLSWYSIPDFIEQHESGANGASNREDEVVVYGSIHDRFDVRAITMERFIALLRSYP